MSAAGRERESARSATKDWGGDQQHGKSATTAHTGGSRRTAPGATSRFGRRATPVGGAGTGGGTGVSPVDAAEAAAEGRRCGGLVSASPAILRRLRPSDVVPGSGKRLLVDALWADECTGDSLPLSRLSARAPSAAGVAGSGAGTNQWLAGAPAGRAGSAGLLSHGGPTGVAVVRGKGERDGGLAGSAAVGRGGRPTQRGLKCLSRRRSPTAGAPQRCPAGGGVERGWLPIGDASEKKAPAAGGGREATAPASGPGGSFPRGKNGRAVVAQRA